MEVQVLELASPKKGKSLLFSGILTLLLFLGQSFKTPNTVKDIVTGTYPLDCFLYFPKSYLFFSPFFSLFDHLTLLSLKQHVAFILLCVLIWILFRSIHLVHRPITLQRLFKELGKFILFGMSYLLVIALAVFLPRPLASLRVNNPDLLVVDFHSHTNSSWDARKSFTSEKNIDWHFKAGFDACFITDHNVFNGSLLSYARAMKGESKILSFLGEEVSLHESHWVVLGLKELIPNGPYDQGKYGLEIFLKEMRKDPKILVIASLPEYWKYHWNSDLDDFANWGLSGFEIVNSAPLALDFDESFRNQIIGFCRKHNLFMTGVTDNHGWGFTNYVWNIIELPGWRKLPTKDIESALLRLLREKRFNAVKVIVRVKKEAKTGWVHLLIDPILVLWTLFRTLPFNQIFSWLFWIWLPYFFINFKRKSYN